MSKFHYHKLTSTCVIDRLYKGTNTQTLEFECIAYYRIVPRPSATNEIIEQSRSGFAFNEVAIFRPSTVFLRSAYGLKEHKHVLWRLHVSVDNIIETLWCYKCTLLNSFESFFNEVAHNVPMEDHMTQKDKNS